MSLDTFLSLKPSVQSAVEAFAQHSTIEAVSLATGLSKPTLNRYRADPKFQKALREYMAAAREAAHRRLAQASASAVDVLIAVQNDSRVSARDRIAAASSLLAFMFKSEQAMLAQRLEELEGKLEALTGGTPAPTPEIHDDSEE